MLREGGEELGSHPAAIVDADSPAIEARHPMGLAGDREFAVGVGDALEQGGAGARAADEEDVGVARRALARGRPAGPAGAPFAAPASSSSQVGGSLHVEAPPIAGIRGDGAHLGRRVWRGALVAQRLQGVAGQGLEQLDVARPHLLAPVAQAGGGPEPRGLGGASAAGPALVVARHAVVVAQLQESGESAQLRLGGRDQLLVAHLAVAARPEAGAFAAPGEDVAAPPQRARRDRLALGQLQLLWPLAPVENRERDVAAVANQMDGPRPWEEAVEVGKMAAVSGALLARQPLAVEARERVVEVDDELGVARGGAPRLVDRFWRQAELREAPVTDRAVDELVGQRRIEPDWQVDRADAE